MTHSAFMIPTGPHGEAPEGVVVEAVYPYRCARLNGGADLSRWDDPHYSNVYMSWQGLIPQKLRDNKILLLCKYQDQEFAIWLFDWNVMIGARSQVVEDRREWFDRDLPHKL